MSKLPIRDHKWYGYTPDLPDFRDLTYKVSHGTVADLPPSVDLSPTCGPVLSQENLGACTAFAISGAIMFAEKKDGQVPLFIPSPLFIYYNERVMEGTSHEDAGAQIRDGMKSINILGVCSETTWSYSDGPLKYKQKPVDTAYVEALNHQSITYSRVNQTQNDICGCLSEGYPVVCGFVVYESFESDEVARTGIVPMPQRHEQQQGGHAVYIIGYDLANRQYRFRNSWGTDWGDEGDFYMPFDYVHSADLFSDFWTIRKME